jgi:hypothetical protein
MEPAFPAGNSAFLALREDHDAMQRYLPLFQQELLRRHGVSVTDFFRGGVFIQDLLPALRPDLAILLQSDLFNTSLDSLLAGVTGDVAEKWRAEVQRRFAIPTQIHAWRSVIWDVIREPTYQRVQSFAELSTALYSRVSRNAGRAKSTSPRGARVSPALADFFRTAPLDDEMRGFLSSAVEYLSTISEGNLEVPVSIIRAMNDAERLAQIEETSLPPEKQSLLRHCVLQIARLTGENG